MSDDSVPSLHWQPEKKIQLVKYYELTEDSIQVSTNTVTKVAIKYENILEQERERKKKLKVLLALKNVGLTISSLST